MDQLENYNAELDRYFRGEMNEEESKAFLSQVESEPELKKLFDEHGDIVRAIEISSLTELKDKLAQKEKEMSKPSGGIPLYLKIAAGVCLLAIASWLLFRGQPNDINPEQLFAANYEPYPNIVTPVDRSSVADNTDPYAQFELKAYDESLELFKTLPENDTTLFYIGQVHLAMKKPQMAIAYFRKVRPNSTFKEAADWYTALAYLSDLKVDEGKGILKVIKNSDSSYRSRAEELLDQL